VGGHPLPDEGFSAGSLDQTVNRPWGEGNHPVRAMFPQGGHD
jgi:hypothetical protein